eukprot:28117-Eustigmatos_ZCMA.PRE.1
MSLPRPLTEHGRPVAPGDVLTLSTIHASCWPQRRRRAAIRRAEEAKRAAEQAALVQAADELSVNMSRLQLGPPSDMHMQQGQAVWGPPGGGVTGRGMMVSVYLTLRSPRLKYLRRPTTIL